MKLGVLFSGGKDSTYAALLAKEYGHELSCLISIFSKNKDSFMFHTPSISKVSKQAEVMKIPLIIQETYGEENLELLDLKKAIKKAVKEYAIEGIVSGAVESVYQASRVQRICNELGIECFNPLWLKNSEEIILELIEKGFESIVTGVAAYPLDKSFLGRKINKIFLDEFRELNKKYRISITGEGGEFESFVLDCPLFEKPLILKDFEDSGEKNNWRRELTIK